MSGHHWLVGMPLNCVTVQALFTAISSDRIGAPSMRADATGLPPESHTAMQTLSSSCAAASMAAAMAACAPASEMSARAFECVPRRGVLHGRLISGS